jgi:pyruvate,water dikinase
MNQTKNTNYIGNKAKHLKKLKQENLPVPKFSCLSSDQLYFKTKNLKKVLDQVQTKYSETSKQSNVIQRKINATTDQNATQQVINEIDSYPVILRMSVSGEDSNSNSFAGLFDSAIVRSKNDVTKALSTCLQSLGNHRVLAYCNKHNINVPTNFSLIIQSYINTDIGGVAFVEPNKKQLTLSWNQGAASAVVEGKSNKTLQIDTGKLNEKEIVSKITEINFDTRQAHKLYNIFQKIVSLQGSGQDIEWGIKNGSTYIFQARTITKSPHTKDAKRGSGVTLDATNISESYPGVTLPLTFSFIKDAYSRVYPSFLSSLGISEKKLEQKSEIFDNMLDTVRGRVYYQIENWYKTISFLPASQTLQNYFEDMLQPKKNKSEKQSKGSVLPLIPLFMRLFVMMLRRKYQLKKFNEEFDKTYDLYQKYRANLSGMSAKELLKKYQTIHSRIFSFWHLAIANDFRVMIFHGLLKHWWTDISDNSHRLHATLTNKMNLKSAIPLQELKKLRNTIQKSPEARDVWESKVSAKSKYRSLRKIDTIREKIELYIEKYGDRAPAELKLESPTLREVPENIISLLEHADHEVNQESGNRDGAVKQNVTERYGYFLGTVFYPFLSLLISQTQKAIATREEMRIARSRAYGIARTFFREIGSRFANDDIIKNEEDIFYLKISEIRNRIKNNSYVSFYSLVKNRKREYNTYKNQPDPPMRIISYPDGSYTDATKANSEKGVGGAPGVVSGEALVLTSFDPEANYENKILVTHQTDPGWTLVFGSLSGVVTERGNPLSHAAIVARELDIPACLAIPNATDRINTGDEIKIDGTTGQVKKV